MTYKLILLRHGESEWNAKNLFTGWVDVDLNAKGEAEALRGGDLLVENDLLPDVLHTSLLKRAIRTSQLALQVADRHWIPTKRSWRLNERHYGALQGKDKAQTLEEFGNEQFMLWRRSFDVPPPPLAADSPYSQVNDPRYAHIDGEVPDSESLKLAFKPPIRCRDALNVPTIQSVFSDELQIRMRHRADVARRLAGPVKIDRAVLQRNFSSGIARTTRKGDRQIRHGLHCVYAHCATSTLQTARRTVLRWNDTAPRYGIAAYDWLIEKNARHRRPQRGQQARRSRRRQPCHTATIIPYVI